MNMAGQTSSVGISKLSLDMIAWACMGLHGPAWQVLISLTLRLKHFQTDPAIVGIGTVSM